MKDEAAERMFPRRIFGIIDDEEHVAFVQIARSETGLSAVSLLIEGGEGIFDDRNLRREPCHKKANDAIAASPRDAIVGHHPDCREMVMDQPTFPAILNRHSKRSEHRQPPVEEAFRTVPDKTYDE